MWPNWVDLVVVACALRGGYVGLSRGAPVECLYLVGLIGATALSGNLAGSLIAWLSPWWRYHPSVLNLLGSIGVWLLLVLAVSLALRQSAAWLAKERMPWAFQGLGVAIGGARGLWWAGVLFLFLLSSGRPYLVRSITERSLTAPQVMEVSQKSLWWVADRLPGHAVGSERSILSRKKGPR